MPAKIVSARSSENTTVDGPPRSDNVDTRMRRQENPTTAASTTRRRSAAISGALCVSRGEVASRCAGPTDATCDTHTPPRCRIGQDQRRGTFLVTGRRHYRQPWQRPPPSEITPAKSSARKHPNSEATFHSPSPNIGLEAPAKNYQHPSPRIASARRSARVKSSPPGRTEKAARTQRPRSVARTPASTPSQRDGVDRGSRLGRPGDGRSSHP